MATVITTSEIVASFNTTTGNVDFTDVATGLLVWGSIKIHMLKTPSILRDELESHSLALANDRPGAWSVVKAFRDKFLADLGLRITQI